MADLALVPPDQGDGLSKYVYRRSQLGRIPKPMPLVGPLVCNSYAILAGRDGTYKSFWALDVALHLATGLTYHDGQTVKQQPVIYVAAEGGPGLDDRIKAFEEHHGVNVLDEFLTVVNRGFSFYRDADYYLVEQLRDLVREVQPGLIILDTLRRISGGADENSSTMGVVIDRVIELARVVDGCTALVVAHTGKSNQDARGFSGIEDDADTVLHVALSKGTHTMVVTNAKSKYGSAYPTQHFRARRVAESLILEPKEPEPPRIQLLENQRLIIQSLGDGQARSAKDLQGLTGLGSSSCRSALDRLTDSGYTQRQGKRNSYRWTISPDCPPELLQAVEEGSGLQSRQEGDST